jgi:hypothetical protein
LGGGAMLGGGGGSKEEFQPSKVLTRQTYTLDMVRGGGHAQQVVKPGDGKVCVCGGGGSCPARSSHGRPTHSTWWGRGHALSGGGEGGGLLMP